MNSRQNGFTAVELMIALLVLSVAIIAMAGVMTQTRRMQGLALSRAELTAVAESKFEELRGAAAGAAAAPASLTTGGSLTADTMNKFDETTSASGRHYRRRWQVSGAPEGSVHVTLRVLPAQSSHHELSQLNFSTIIFVGE
jgi:prepilin-type N-terminal cleavage/methylation domain-containing protein